MSARRGGIPGPESRTGLVRPAMTEAEFERRQSISGGRPTGVGETAEPADDEPDTTPTRNTSSRSRSSRSKPSKPRRVQRMFAIEDDLDRKLWLYAIHIGKDRSEVVNELLRPVVASMVLYDSRDRRSSRSSNDSDSASEGQGTETAEAN